jgi:hypothetical protein
MFIVLMRLPTPLTLYLNHADPVHEKQPNKTPILRIPTMNAAQTDPQLNSQS